MFQKYLFLFWVPFLHCLCFVDNVPCRSPQKYRILHFLITSPHVIKLLSCRNSNGFESLPTACISKVSADAGDISSRWENGCHRHPTTTYLCSLRLSLFFLLPLALTIRVPSSIALIRPGPLFRSLVRTYLTLFRSSSSHRTAFANTTQTPLFVSSQIKSC